MNNKYQIIRKTVKSQLQLRGITDNKSVDEFAQTCFDEYKISLDSGMSEADALKQAYTSLNETLDTYKISKKINVPYRYSLILSVISFMSCLIVSILGWLISDVLSVYGVIYPILFVLAIVILVYTISTFKKRNKLDIAIATVLFLSVLSIFIQCVIYFYRARTGDFYYSLDYIFPGILNFNRHVLVSVEPLKYELASCITLFDPTLIISFISLITSVLYNIIKRRKNIC